MTLMRPALAVLATLAVAAPAHASESLWIDLSAARILAPLCPSEFKANFGALTAADLAEPLAAIDARETAETARVLTKGDRAEARKAMDAYAVLLADEVKAGHERLGCPAVFNSLQLTRPKPWEHDELMTAARDTPLPRTERPANLPATLQNGTQAAPNLQRTILLTLADEENACDPKTARVAQIAQDSVLARYAPPFVGEPKAYRERWTLTCHGKPKAFLVSFQQDARTWRRYTITPDETKP